jgi:hypothetical protein
MNLSACFSIALACGLACACGGGSTREPGEEIEQEDLSPNTRSDSPRVRQLRVDLAGTDAALRILRARLVEVPEDALPIPSLGGTSILVGYSSAGTPLAAMPFSLPKVFRVEGSKDGVDPGRELPLSEGRLSLFLDARTELARIDVLGESGAQLATLAESEFEEAPTVLKQSSVDAPPPQQGLARDYPHIDFLGPDEDVGVFSPEFSWKRWPSGSRKRRISG